MLSFRSLLCALALTLLAASVESWSDGGESFGFLWDSVVERVECGAARLVVI